jgi:PAS domain S-box-containing protein
MLAVVWNRTLRLKVAKATTALQQELRERQRVEAALRRSEGKLALHLDQTLVGVIEFDRDFRVAYWNPAAERIFGWSKEEVTGRIADFLLPPELRPALREEWRQLLAGTGGWHKVNANLTRDGGPITCEWFNTALADDAGHVHGVMSMALDVSERERREEAQTRAQRLESLAVLAGGIAHDFNNLLTGIIGNLSLLLQDDPPRAVQAELLSEAEAAAWRAQALTRQLLTFARGGAPVKALLDLGPLARQAALFASRGSAGTCRVEVPEGLWPVEADAGQLGQVVQNLVLNALEARPDGLVEISLANVERDPPAVPAGPCVRLRVSDQGPGIPTERQHRIFDPFYSTKERGSGLGLAVTHSIVTRHGGLVEVRSAAGQGTTFDLFLPALPDRTVVLPAPRALAPAMRLRVLVMDDDESIRRVAQRALTPAGCEVEVAADGEEAVARWRAAREAGRAFDLVVLDLTVPGGMAGQETLAVLRALDPGVQAIVSSGYSSSHVMAEYRAHGFAAAIKKPWSADELRRAVAAVGDGPGASQA